LELCWEIEKLPASEQQTKCSVMASELYRDYTMVNDAIRRATLDEAARRIEALRTNEAGVEMYGVEYVQNYGAVIADVLALLRQMRDE